ncbi:MAG: putative metal transporter metal-binding protein [Ilumatobacteraceae bacterium]|nr:putative metal transporter metal-binding protein [Ilumatobacteraceae bacterium]
MRAAALLAMLALVAVACQSAAPSKADRGAPVTATATATAAAATATGAGKVAAFACPAGASQTGAVATRRRDGRLQVVTTVAPITSIVANVAGERADVQGVIPEGEDSHTYEPKPSVAALLSAADIVFVNGLKLEDPTKDIAEQNLSKSGEVVELGTQTIGPDEYIYDFSFPKDGGKPNPHLWTDPPMAKCYALIAASAMSRADPANASYYTANATRFEAKIDRLDQLMKDATASMPAQNRALLTYHDAYAYFAVHYGWRIIGAIQVSSFEDPTPREVASLIEQVEKEKVPAIFGSEVFPSPVLAQIAEETGVTYVDKLRDDDLPGGPGDGDHSYLGLMKFDFVTMVSNLGGDASALQAFDATDVVHDDAGYPQ